MTNAFEFSNVCKRFGKKVALDKVSISSGAGQVVALLGENGAGKTTALRILLGLTAPDSGHSEVLGLDSRQEGRSIRRLVGYVAEQPTLYDWMTVDEIGWFASGFYPKGYLSAYGVLVRNFNLPENRKLKALSKGMRAKVALALAMAHGPALLVLDEPTSGLDSMVRREFLESMVDVASSGRTVLLSSHQIAEVERVADVVAILREGRLVAVEDLDRLKRTVRELTITLHNGAPEAPQVPGTVIRREWKPPTAVSLASGDRDSFADRETELAAGRMPACQAAVPAAAGRNRDCRQWRMLVRDVDDSQLDALRGDERISRLEVRCPSLEEIFVGYMRGDVPDEETSTTP